MAGNVRGRLLALFKILTEQTDESRTLTMPELLQKLEILGFSADRRALYEDIEALNNAGWEIQRSETGKRGYFFASRDFDDAEIGLLLDSLYTCSFLPENRLHRLSDKLVRLGTSALTMNRIRRNNLLIAQSREHDNHSIYTVDLLYRAIGEERMVSFLPYHLDWHKRRAFDSVVPIQVKPLHLVWSDNMYYLIAANEDGTCAHWRVDRLANLELLGFADGFRRRINDAELKSYARHVFGPASGRPIRMTLKCAKHAAEMVYEKFGTNVAPYAFQEDTFNIDIWLTPSCEFYGWLIAHGDEIELLAPEAARNTLKELVLKRKKQYGD